MGHDLDFIVTQAGLEVGYDFVEIEVRLALGLADEVVVIGFVGNAELRIIEVGTEFRHQRQFAALGQLIEGSIVNGKARNAGIAAHLKCRVEVVAVVTGHDDDGIIIHSLFTVIDSFSIALRCTHMPSAHTRPIKTASIIASILCLFMFVILFTLSMSCSPGHGWSGGRRAW